VYKEHDICQAQSNSLSLVNRTICEFEFQPPCY